MKSNKCRLCGADLGAETLLTLNGMPEAAQFYPEEHEFEGDKGIDLDIYQCKCCGLVQLSGIEPVDYYREVITAASFSEKTTQARLKQMNEFVEGFKLHGKKVLDVGSSKGNMLDILKMAGVEPTGIEASPDSVKVALDAGRPMIEGYIGEMETVPGAPYDGFISLNYLEHLPYPGEIIQKVYNQTTPDAVGYVTVPNLEYLLETKCFYEFVADHLSYFTKSSITHAFESNGFDVLECYTINNDNDIVAIVKKRPLLSIKDQYQEVESLIKDYQDLFAKYKKHNKKIAVWGAGHRTLALLALAGLENLEYVVDSASFKQGKFTPVLHSKIVPPDHLRENPVDLVIVMVPGLYPDEVLKTLRKMDLDTEIATLKDNKLEFE